MGVAARAVLEPQGRWQALADDVDAFFRGKADADWGYSWVPVVAPLLGAAIAAGVAMALPV